LKPLVCPNCLTPAPEQVEPVYMQLGGYVAFVCLGCKRTLEIPWGRVPLWLIERAREAEGKKG
jgi:RNase P subunit RPR2